MSLDTVLTILADGSPVLALIIGVMHYKALKNAFVLIFIHIILAIIVEGVGSVIRYSNGNNSFVYNLYILILFPVIIAAAQKILYNYRRYYFDALALLYILLWCFFYFESGPGVFQKYTYVVGSIIVVFLFLVVLIVNFRTKDFLRSPLFILSLAIIFYYGCGSPLISLLDYLILSKNLTDKLFPINLLLDTIYYALIGVSFLGLKNNQSKLAASNEYRQ